MIVRQNCLPRSLSIDIVKWQSLYGLLGFSVEFGPQKEHSKVKLLIKWNSRHMTTLAVVSRSFYTLKLLFAMLKCSDLLENKYGKIRSFRRSFLVFWQPYMKMFFCLE